MMPENQLPRLERIYQNHTLDSTRWDGYTPRDGDIIVSTSYKSGTTWMQNIVLQLIFLGQDVPEAWDVSPWLDSRVGRPIEEIIASLDAQSFRRCIKSHLALDGLPYHEAVKYIIVGRDARDVFMSWWNHYSNFTDNVYTYLNETPGRVGPPLPRCPQDINAYWRTWITRGWFPWEQEGYPHSGNMHHTQSWWKFRHLENLHFVHFNDLLANLEGEIERVANFLEITLPPKATAAIAQAVSFATMKKNATKDPAAGMETWKDGMNTFFYKGTNGRWKGVLSEDDLRLYEVAKSQLLPPECARWLEQGRAGLNP